MMNDHPALRENLYKDIPKLPQSRMVNVAMSFGISDVADFDPEGDRARKSIPWSNISRAVLARDEYRCRVCGNGSLSTVDNSRDYNKIHFELEVHHIIPRKDGGSDTFQNLISLCEGCHHKTFAGGYSGVPVEKNMDLFSFDKTFLFALPADSLSLFRGNIRSATLEDYDRVFDQSENRYRVVPMLNTRMRINVAELKVEDYRELVTAIMRDHEVSDYVTLEAKAGTGHVNVRILTDTESDLII